MIYNIRSNKKVFILILSAIVFTLVLTLVIVAFTYHNKLVYNYFYKGISIEGIDVSGLTKAQAMEKIESGFSKDFQETSIALRYSNKKWIIPLNNIEYRYDFESTVNTAYNLGREGTRQNRIKTIQSLKKIPVNLILSVKYDDKKLLNMLLKVKKEIDFLPKSSTYNYNYGRIIYTGDVDGKNFDLDENKQLIDSHLLNRNFNDISLEVTSIKPTISLADVKDIKDVLGYFTTSFNSANHSRSANIELACKKINNYLLKPGQEFSMNSALGPRTSKNGYKQAPIIVKDSMVTGTGGGVCQVASTLYNSVLMSMLTVTSRVNHSILPLYVPPSQDATISEDYIDFKFKNNRDYTICIAAETSGNTLTIKIIGKKRDDDPDVVLKPTIVAEYDPPDPEYVIDDGLPDSQQVVLRKGEKGMKVILYRETYSKEGAFLRREKIHEDIYKPIREKIAINKKTLELLRN